MHRRALLIALAFGVLSLAAPVLCRGQALVLDNLVVDNQAGSVMVRFGVDIEGLGEIMGSLDNGTSFALTGTARLSRDRDYWTDATVAEAEYVSTLSYDTLTKEYAIKLPGREQPLKNRDLAALIRQAWSSVNLDLGPWDALERGHSYTMHLKIKLNRTDVPDWMRWTLFFWSWDPIPATTYRLDFTY